MPELIAAPTRIPVPGGKIIEEYVGAVTTPDVSLGASVSVAHMAAPAGWSEPAQTPDFDEITVVLTGQVLVEHEGGVLTVGAGQTAISRRGERVRYSCGDEGAEYISVCLPAFTEAGVNREGEA